MPAFDLQPAANVKIDHAAHSIAGSAHHTPVHITAKKTVSAPAAGHHKLETPELKITSPSATTAAVDSPIKIEKEHFSVTKPKAVIDPKKVDWAWDLKSEVNAARFERNFDLSRESHKTESRFREEINQFVVPIEKGCHWQPFFIGALPLPSGAQLHAAVTPRITSSLNQKEIPRHRDQAGVFAAGFVFHGDNPTYISAAGATHGARRRAGACRQPARGLDPGPARSRRNSS